MDFFKDKIVFPEMLKLLFLSFAWLGNSGMCVLVGGGRAVNRKHHPAERCDLRFGFQSARKNCTNNKKNCTNNNYNCKVEKDDLLTTYIFYASVFQKVAFPD